ncbi:MAG: class I SAM-dependent methyltransferase [Acidobacteriota bacterium]|nr:class I SAM-dependent methyltransferase [Acidobacteriota bacterium]
MSSSTIALPAIRPAYYEIANLEIPKLLEGLPRGITVLDAGCGSGVHGAEIKRLHGHRVTGVDLSAASIVKARTRIDEAHVGDVTRPEAYPFYGQAQFDVIVFSDILEHICDPRDVVGRHLPLLRAGGRFLISIPNIAIWNVRFGLLFGRFDYHETGTMDKTHLRFFTQRTFREFAQAAGLRIVKQRPSPGVARAFVPLVKRLYERAGAVDGSPNSSSIMESGPYRFYTKWLYPIEAALCRLWPGMFTFQIVCLCEPVEGGDTCSQWP